MNLVTAIPQIILVHSMGNYVAALGQADDLHGHSFAFTGVQVGRQLPSTLLEPPAGASTTLPVVRRDTTTPSLAALKAHYTHEGASLLMPSTTVGVNKQVEHTCMIPLMWAPYFIEGGTPKATYDKIEMLVAASPESHQPSFEFIQDWGNMHASLLGTPLQPHTNLVWQ
jgi:hypothetical protein